MVRIINTINKRNISLKIGNTIESIIQQKSYPLKLCKSIINNNIISVIGYGAQGKSQALNLRDNGYNVILGLRDGYSYQEALNDGWKERHNLFCIEEAVEKGNIIKYLLSDIGQIKQWDNIYSYLTMDKTLYFSHGFGITFSSQTKIVPPDHIDVIMVSPKGAGTTVREKFLNNEGFNASYSIHQDYSGLAKEKCLALAFSIGCKNLFETTFKKEVYSDLVGERCVLMGMIQGAFSAQYSVLREKGHSPAEAYNETVEEALISLYPLIKENGMEWLYTNCSTTAQRGALDWAPIFEKALKPIIQDCYAKVENGYEVAKLINMNNDPSYNNILNKQLSLIKKQELWRVANEFKKLR